MKLENPLQTKSFRKRRARLARALGPGVVILPTAPERSRNADSHYDYRWDSGFYYLTGFREPEAVLVMVLDPEPRSILFCREKNLEREIWDGFRYGPELARDSFGFDEAHPYTELDARMPDLLADREALHTPVGFDAAWDQRIAGWLNTVRAKVRSGVSAPDQIRDVRAAINDMRLFKDEDELAVMRRAAEISSAAHARAMRAAAPGKREYEIEAELIHEFCRNGARSPAYGSIVAAGANACVLHYRENSAELRKGDLMLIDAGCELASYASDITRTFPIGARFSAVQRDVYELALQGQRRQGARGWLLSPVLHAPHGPLARPRRARRGRLHAEGQVAQAQAGNGAHGRARVLHPPGQERAEGVLEHRRAHRGRRPCHRSRARGPHRRMSEDGEGGRGDRPRPVIPRPRRQAWQRSSISHSM